MFAVLVYRAVVKRDLQQLFAVAVIVPYAKNVFFAERHVDYLCASAVEYVSELRHLQVVVVVDVVGGEQHASEEFVYLRESGLLFERHIKIAVSEQEHVGIVAKRSSVEVTAES